MKFTLINLSVFIVILIIGVLIYYPCFNFGFLLYDDPEYVMDNYFLRDFSFRGIINLFTNKVYDLYIPITWLSYWVEQSIFKFSAKGMHLTNVILHITNAYLIFKVFLKLFNKSFPAFLTALLFLVHPQHIESVAWIAERKDVLYTLFYLLSILFYMEFKTETNSKYYYLVLLFFILSCLSNQ